MDAWLPDHSPQTKHVARRNLDKLVMHSSYLSWTSLDKTELKQVHDYLAFRLKLKLVSVVFSSLSTQLLALIHSR